GKKHWHNNGKHIMVEKHIKQMVFVLTSFFSFGFQLIKRLGGYMNNATTHRQDQVNYGKSF
ncbi:MAG: hypothetical protein VX436_03840, partial [Planctomycetota bacterium]|nr:hypothetical protein [Planctomycetota bacterium]